MKQTAAFWVVCVSIGLATGQYAAPPTKGKKHRTTTTTTENPSAVGNEISAPFPFPDAESNGASSAAGSFSSSSTSSGSPNLPGSNAVTGGGYWWAGPNSPFKPGSQPGSQTGGGCGGGYGPGGCGAPPPPPPPPSSGGCGGPAGCTGLGTDPRPAPAQPPKPVDIENNPFLSSAILGKPIPSGPQGCQGGPCGAGAGPVPGSFPNAPSSAGQYPAQYPGSKPTGYPTGSGPGQPTGQYPPGPQGCQSGACGTAPSPGSFPDTPSSPGQYPAQYPGSKPTGYPSGSGPGQPSGHYPPGPQGCQSGNCGAGVGPTPGTFPTQYPGSPPRYPGSTPTGYPVGSGPGQPTGQPGGANPNSVPLRPQCSAAGHACVPAQMCVGGVITSNGMNQIRDPKIKECIPGLEACCRIPPTTGPLNPGYGAPVTTQRPYTGPLNTTPYPGCAAALKCVPENYCTADGVMSNSPVILTREQQDNKVPLSECFNMETGVIGKCCKDPNYKDPWPAGMMMGNGMSKPGDFDDGQYHGEFSGPGPSYNSISSTPHTPSKDHGPKPSDRPGGFNKPFPPPFPGNTPSGSPFSPGKPQPPLSPYQPGKGYTNPGQPNQPTPGAYQPGNPAGGPNQPNQPQPPLSPYAPGTGYNYPGQPKPNQPYQGPYQPGNPTGTPQQPSPGQPRPSIPTQGSYQPGHPIGTHQPIPQNPNQGSYQPGNPTGAPYQPSPSNPNQGAYQPGNPTGTPYQPGPGQPSPSNPNQGAYQPENPTGAPYQPGPGQPSPSNPNQGAYQPGNPTGAQYQPGPGQPSPSNPNQGSYQPGNPTGTPYQPIPSQPSPSIPTQGSYQPGKPTGTPYQPIPGQPSPSIPTHPGHQDSSPNQGEAPGSSCGIRRHGSDGDVAGFGEFPWQALVMSAGNRTLLCGAALISETAVITAAHCVDNLRSRDLLVKAGEDKLLAPNPKAVQVRPVGAISWHPSYDSASRAYDLAILTVSQPFTPDTHVDKICVPPNLGSNYLPQPGQKCFITGWGKLALLGPVQGSDMHKVEATVLPAKTCESQLKSTSLGKYFILNEGFSCAVPPSPSDLCKVDTGSAVACARPDGHYELAGVNSWDIPCPVNEPRPSVFTNSDASWINTVLNTPLPVLQAEEEDHIQSLSQGENIPGIDTDDKPGFSQGYGK